LSFAITESDSLSVSPTTIDSSFQYPESLPANAGYENPAIEIKAIAEIKKSLFIYPLFALDEEIFSSTIIHPHPLPQDIGGYSTIMAIIHTWQVRQARAGTACSERTLATWLQVRYRRGP
jgi:hypothetical protein